MSSNASHPSGTQPSVAENMAWPELGSRLPLGFSFAGAHCGIKRNRLDLALLRVDGPEGAAAAGCFTRNHVRAACVQRNSSLVPREGVRAVIINSGNANAMTGEQGRAADVAMAQSVATALGVEVESVLTSSTGVIGTPLPVEKIAEATPAIAGKLGPEVGEFAQAILTTDTCTKTAWVEFPLAGGSVRILGVAKGSGMIHPNMATTLGYVVTDAKIDAPTLQALLSRHIERSFNAITVDGDTSTNDTVLCLASGQSGVELSDDADHHRFSEALREVLQSLARQVARDGEGATRLLEVVVRGAPDDASAAKMARAVARSSLFKCSVFAGEAGWGRAAAAAGQAAREANVSLDAETLEISAQGVALVRAGRPLPEPPGFVRQLVGSEVHWSLNVGDGPGEFTAWGCDLSYDYVRINADESLQIEVRPDGRVGRNLSLETYTPKLKHQLLVDGLGYMRRFTGMRVLVHAHGAVLRRPTLLGNLVRDLELMVDAAMRPLVILTEAEAEAMHAQLAAAFDASVYNLARVEARAAKIQPRLDRGQACVVVEPELPAARVAGLAAKLGAGKLLVLDDDRGLHDDRGLVERIEPAVVIEALDDERLASASTAFLGSVREGVKAGLPAIHLVDGRIPHALVAELFTDRGVGTLVSQQEPLSR